MKDYLGAYAKKAQMFQDGGAMPADPNAMPAEGAAPAAPQGGGTDIQSMLMEFAQSQDPNLAVAICNAILQEMQAAAQAEGGQPAPAMRRGGFVKTPVFRKGGKLI